MSMKRLLRRSIRIFHEQKKLGSVTSILSDEVKEFVFCDKYSIYV